LDQPQTGADVRHLRAGERCARFARRRRGINSSPSIERLPIPKPNMN
jgi:hypothetical protein